MKWKCSSFEFDTRMPIVMGILNVTPDSFSDGGAYMVFDNALAHALTLIEEGAHIIDVGGESTRPGSAAVSLEEECARTIELVKALADQGICVSIDTRHAKVARACIEAGASIINDISGFEDPAMLELACSTEVGLVVMHMKGSPDTMQDDPTYHDVLAEVLQYLRARTAFLEEAGIAAERICVDPGPGFGKTVSQTRELVRNFHEFVHLGYPVMAALSRKSYIGHSYRIEDPKDRDEVSAEEALMACELGCSVIRTHSAAHTVVALKNLRPYAILGLGCNVALVAHPGEEREGKIAQLNQAISGLCTLPDSQLIDISSFYESEAAYWEDQEAFVNAVVLLRTGLSPKDLLGYVHVIENSLGRVRSGKNGPRTCDIDILDYQRYTSNNQELILPHPGILERDFVVQPLLEILPGHTLADGTLVTNSEVRVGKAQKL